MLDAILLLNRQKMFRTIVFCAGVAVCFSASGDDASEIRQAGYEKAAEIFRTRCIRCHGQKVRKAELDLTSIPGIRKGGESGPVLNSEEPAESLLLKYILDGTMPPEGEGQLSDNEKRTVVAWGLVAAKHFSETKTAPQITQHDVLPSLLLRCGACHGRNKQEAGLDIRTKASLLKGGRSGPAIVLGEPNESPLIKRLIAEDMPPRRQLIAASVKPMPSDEIETLTRWIAAGAPEITVTPDIDSGQPDPLVSDNDRRFWSFQSPKKPVVPGVRHTELVRSPIDAFLLQKLEERQLTLSAEADRHTLIRRATFDLLGLPPTPDDISAFVDDRREDAFEQLIDRLLRSPRYGERWGQHWLDLAGYSDSEGIQHADPIRKHNWRYRDYVIRAFNDDKPYDRFLMEQIAGDELADYEGPEELTPELYDNLVATGFLRQAPDATFAGLTGFVPDRLEIIDDEFEVLSSAIMGLTIKCARCHSHKFDPIPQRDYYRLSAVFKGAFDQHGWLKPDERLLPYSLSEDLRQWKDAGEKKEDRPQIRALVDRGGPSPTYILKRGNYLTRGRPVGPGVPSVLTNGENTFEVSPPWQGAQKTGRRLAFAKWLTRKDHPLTARVIVNRIWKHHFGRGIVTTLDNFGRAGARPTHPDLLDWLAVTFIEDGFSIKAMHRRIMTSAAWRQSSAISERHSQLDPDNDLYSRMNLRRMDGEVVRDALLAVADRLNETMFGPADGVTSRADGLVTSVPYKESNRWRRSVYVLKRRTQPVTILQNFDVTRMDPNCVDRPESIVAPQALQLKNSKWVYQMSGALRDRIWQQVRDDPSGQIRAAWQIAAGRIPDEAEMATSQELLQRLTEDWYSKNIGTPHEIPAITHLWIRESEPERVFEDDLISVWSSKSSDKARRRGLVEFDISRLTGLDLKKAELQFGVLQKHPIRQSAVVIPSGIETYNWRLYEQHKSAHEKKLESLGRIDSAQRDAVVGARLSCEGASVADLALLLHTAKDSGRLTLMLQADEDGNDYHRDWDDGVYKSTRNNPPLLVVYDSRPNLADARRRALHDYCHALINSAAFLYID